MDTYTGARYTTPPLIRGSTAAAYLASGGPAAPATTEIGDLVIVFWWTVGGAGVPTHTLQPDFAEITSESHDDGSADGRLSAAYKRATVTGAVSYEAYVPSGGSNYVGIVVFVKGTFDPDRIGDVFDSADDVGASPPDPPSVTTPSDNAVVLTCGAWHLGGSAAPVAVTPPSGYTELWELAGSFDGELAVAYKVIETAGAENPGAFADDVAPNGTVALSIVIRSSGWAKYVPVPIKGDGRTPAICEPAWERLADREAYIADRRPVLGHYAGSGSPLSVYGDYVGGPTVGWDPVDYDYEQLLYSPGSGVDFTGCVVGDKILVTASVLFAVQNATSGFACLIAADAYVSGIGTVLMIPGTLVYKQAPHAYDDGFKHQITLSGVWTVATPGTTRVSFGYQMQTGISTTFDLYSLVVNATRFPV